MRRFNAKVLSSFDNKKEAREDALQKLVENFEHVDNIMIAYTIDNETEKDSTGTLMRWRTFLSAQTIPELTKFFRVVTDELFNRQCEIIEEDARNFVTKAIIRADKRADWKE